MWQDNEIKFDSARKHLRLRHGERLIDRLDMIEDTKGNAGEKGRLTVTNLRIIWECLSLTRINLSIGYNTFVSATTKMTETVNLGLTQCLVITCSFKNCRYEFLFTNLDTKCSRHYTSVVGVYKAYNSSKVFREIKLRGGIIQEKRLVLLPGENMHTNLPGVWNLSTEQGNIGTFIVTNIRLVWYADMNTHFNVSLPYLAVANVNIKSSKFGPTLVIVSNEANGAYILGFRVDPEQKLHQLHKEIIVLYASYNKNPYFGVDYMFEYQAPSSELEPPVETTTVEIEETDNEISNVLSVYITEGDNTKRKPIYSQYLGLAVEEPREGTTLQALWELLPSS